MQLFEEKIGVANKGGGGIWDFLLFGHGILQLAALLGLPETSLILYNFVVQSHI